jgi:hypothetical protein
VELFAADASLVSAIALLRVGVARVLRRESPDAEAAERLSSLMESLIEFRRATSDCRFDQLSPSGGQKDNSSRDRVLASALQLVAAAAPCGAYGAEVVRVAKELMEELDIELPKASAPDSRLAEADASHRGIAPCGARQLIGKS